MSEQTVCIKAVVGLGNPGSRFDRTRHNIGFAVVDALADEYGAQWRLKDMMEIAEITSNDQMILLIKPQTFMNESGKIISFLSKKGITPEEILVVHDELEIPFGQVKYKKGGSHKGHNGLRSLIQAMGPDFGRIRCGIGRPDNKDDVPEYVLTRFRPHEDVDVVIQDAVNMIQTYI